MSDNTHDPGDAVPPGVAPADPASEPTESDRIVKGRLERLHDPEGEEPVSPAR